MKKATNDEGVQQSAQPRSGMLRFALNIFLPEGCGREGQKLSGTLENRRRVKTTVVNNNHRYCHRRRNILYFPFLEDGNRPVGRAPLDDDESRKKVATLQDSRRPGKFLEQRLMYLSKTIMPHRLSAWLLNQEGDIVLVFY